MPLRKLWNSIRGKSEAAPAETNSELNPNSQVDVGSVKVAKPPNVRADQPQSTIPIAKSAGVTKKRSISREDKKLCRRIESLAVNSILEVSVGDGSRSLSMLQSLTHKGHSTPIHYIAIDQFEMGGSELTLRDFHKQLREYPAKAQLVPMPIEAGLDRVVRTFGQVDLIIWSDSAAPTESQQNTINRLSKPTTIVFTHEDGKWSESLSCLASSTKRAA